PFGNLTTVDACANTQFQARKNCASMGLNSIHFVNQEFDAFLATLKTEMYDLIFIDGNHQGKALKKYLFLLEKHAHDETIYIIDDIRWSKDMWQAWEEISKDDKYHLSM